MERPVGRRQQILEALRGSAKAQTVSELARLLRVHGNTVRFHLESLLADGLIEIEDDESSERSVGRPAIRYRAIARVAPSQMRHTETLVKLLLGDLAADPEGAARAEQIGQRWGREQAQKTETGGSSAPLHGDVKALSTLLDDMGFESDPPSNSDIYVKSCPFLDEVQLEHVEEARKAGTRVLPPVCAVHLGVMKGALSQWDAEVAVNDLIPFARVDRCRISLRRER